MDFIITTLGGFSRRVLHNVATCLRIIGPEAEFCAQPFPLFYNVITVAQKRRNGIYGVLSLFNLTRHAECKYI